MAIELSRTCGRGTRAAACALVVWFAWSGRAAAQQTEPVTALRAEVLEVIRQQRAAYSAELKANRELLEKLLAELQVQAGRQAALRRQLVERDARLTVLEDENRRLHANVEKRLRAVAGQLNEETKQRTAADQQLIGQVSRELADAIAKVATARADIDALKHATAPPPPEPYTVQKGDTLGAIAAAFGVSVQALKAANNLKSDVIRPGQKLMLPEQD